MEDTTWLPASDLATLPDTKQSGRNHESTMAKSTHMRPNVGTVSDTVPFAVLILNATRVQLPSLVPISNGLSLHPFVAPLTLLA